jgi:hypothetical protein
MLLLHAGDAKEGVGELQGCRGLPKKLSLGARSIDSIRGEANIPIKEIGGNDDNCAPFVVGAAALFTGFALQVDNESLELRKWLLGTSGS